MMQASTKSFELLDSWKGLKEIPEKENMTKNRNRLNADKANFIPQHKKNDEV